MKLKVLGSSSSGNCYILQGQNETLILECGIKFDEVMKALDFDLSKVVGCLVTHGHGDHSKYVNKFVLKGIDIYMSQGTKDEIGFDNHRINTVRPLEKIQLGEFTILPFDTKHDSKEPLGFLMKHKEMGTMLFATDTYYIEYTFDNLNQILVECNYSSGILSENVDKGVIHPSLKNRVLKSHFELGNVKEFLESNDLKEVRNIVLLHLSSSNSDQGLFQEEIKAVTGKETHVAKKGLELNLNLHLF